MELDKIQRNIWARINQEANARGIKWKTGDAYCLGSVIKEVLHPEVTELIDREVAVELEKLKSEASVNNLLTEDGFWYLEHRLQALKPSKETAEDE